MAQPRTFRLVESGGTGFDDLFFSPEGHLVIVPSGGTGCVHLFDSATFVKTSLCGVSAGGGYAGGHGEGTTSADVGAGFVFAIDRNTQTVKVLDPKGKGILATAALRGGPDYVRWIASNHEVWIAEPDAEQIEIFSLSTAPSPTLTRRGTIVVKGGPESLVIDDVKGRAFTHLWAGGSVAIDLASRALGKIYANGCKGSRGIALHPTRGFLFVGCAEGKAVVLDVDRGGVVLDSAPVPSGVDIIAVNLELRHLYVPAASDGTVTVFGVGNRGTLTRLGAFAAAKGTHCVTSDDHRRVWICAPDQGSVVVFDDGLPAAAE